MAFGVADFMSLKNLTKVNAVVAEDLQGIMNDDGSLTQRLILFLVLAVLSYTESYPRPPWVAHPSTFQVNTTSTSCSSTLNGLSAAGRVAYMNWHLVSYFVTSCSLCLWFRQQAVKLLASSQGFIGRLWASWIRPKPTAFKSLVCEGQEWQHSYISSWGQSHFCHVHV